MTPFNLSKFLKYFILPSGAVTGFTFLSAEDGLSDLISIFSGRDQDSSADLPQVTFKPTTNSKSKNPVQPKPEVQTETTAPDTSSTESKTNPSPALVSSDTSPESAPEIKPSKKCKAKNSKKYEINVFEYTNNSRSWYGAWWAYKYRTDYYAVATISSDCVKEVKWTIKESKKYQGYAYVPKDWKIRYLLDYVNYMSKDAIEAYLKKQVPEVEDTDSTEE